MKGLPPEWSQPFPSARPKGLHFGKQDLVYDVNDAVRLLDGNDLGVTP
jgi:hypothetical protein